MKYKPYFQWIFLGFFLLLSGCAHLQKTQNPHHYTIEAPAVRQAQLAKIKYWRAEGSFAVRETGKDKNAEMADFVWNQFNNKNYRVRISSALGLYLVDIQYEFHVAKLWKNGTHVYTAKTPEALMQKALGWSLPMPQMKYWLKGEVAKNAGHAVTSFDKYGHLTNLHQSGWVIQFAQYHKNENGIDFPRVIVMKWHNYTVKIFVSRFYWYMQPYTLPDVT